MQIVLGRTKQATFCLAQLAGMRFWINNGFFYPFLKPAIILIGVSGVLFLGTPIIN